jgi:uncharacterized iron-regulated membrane protein
MKTAIFEAAPRVAAAFDALNCGHKFVLTEQALHAAIAIQFVGAKIISISPARRVMWWPRKPGKLHKQPTDQKRHNAMTSRKSRSAKVDFRISCSLL